MKTPKREDLLFPELSYKIVGCAFEVYNELGGGHRESYYQRALAESFKDSKLDFQEQVYYPLRFQSKVIGKGFFDFLVENKIIVEIKKGSRYSIRHVNQVFDYLKLSNLQLAILLNFGSEEVSFKRIINITNRLHS